MNDVIPCHFREHDCDWPACPSDCIGRPGNCVTISRAKYEALMAAAKALANLVPRFEKACEIMGNATWVTEEATKRHREAIAALRAAGMLEK